MLRTSMRAESFADFTAALRRRALAHWRLKLWLTGIICVLFWGLYLTLSRHAWRPIRELPLVWLDRWAGFEPRPWAWIYESVFLLTGTIPWLSNSREELRRYVIGFALLSGLSFAIFVLFPVASPRPANLHGSPFLVFITRLDGPLNAFPSLHAGCLVYTLALARRLFRGHGHPAVSVALLAWSGLILYATLATKQHYALDLLAGAALGWLADWFAWRNSSEADMAATKTRRKSGIVSQPGCK
jgi:membrane-associated phospholipid phosphatase